MRQWVKCHSMVFGSTFHLISSIYCQNINTIRKYLDGRRENNDIEENPIKLQYFHEICTRLCWALIFHIINGLMWFNVSTLHVFFYCGVMGTGVVLSPQCRWRDLEVWEQNKSIFNYKKTAKCELLTVMKQHKQNLSTVTDHCRLPKESGLFDCYRGKRIIAQVS